MSARESHQISASTLSAFELVKEVGNACVCIRQPEGEGVEIAARREACRHHFALDFDAGRAVSKHDGHQLDPQKTLKNQSEIGRVSYSWESVPISFPRQACANNHPVDKVMSQGVPYRQVPKLLDIGRVAPLPPACSPEPSEQATPAARLSSIVPSRAANVGRAG